MSSPARAPSPSFTLPSFREFRARIGDPPLPPPNDPNPDVPGGESVLSGIDGRAGLGISVSGERERIENLRRRLLEKMSLRTDDDYELPEIPIGRGQGGDETPPGIDENEEEEEEEDEAARAAAHAAALAVYEVPSDDDGGVPPRRIGFDLIAPRPAARDPAPGQPAAPPTRFTEEEHRQDLEAEAARQIGSRVRRLNLAHIQLMSGDRYGKDMGSQGCGLCARQEVPCRAYKASSRFSRNAGGACVLCRRRKKSCSLRLLPYVSPSLN
ncbi:hypothetical protein P154DRAFT_10855 [Amniculicola lignicola CBS 123094]|uniref:Zn(2)-C6 fungal-type domain-containing protein n=1 Tax=Amniculicola lignicola CBS 123094 TaxID=1392246 RepID=A0A6A5X4M1_9PLEO|nr:hypothetical protein P154DRAFT_10855 [Amniculicola lignicola CBS 123094]